MTTLYVGLRQDLAKIEEEIGIPHGKCQSVDQMCVRLSQIFDRYYELEKVEDEEERTIFTLSNAARTRRYRASSCKFKIYIKEYHAKKREEIRAYNREYQRKRRLKERTLHSENVSKNTDLPQLQLLDCT